MELLNRENNYNKVFGNKTNIQINDEKLKQRMQSQSNTYTNINSL